MPQKNEIGMIIPRPKYLSMLVENIGNGLVKIITGGRRCGKSFLLFRLFHDYLLEEGVPSSHIIEIALDDRENIPYRNPDKLLEYIKERLYQDDKTHYVILDEIQLVDDFVSVLLSLMHRGNIEVYVSGSNSRFLSSDVVTEFRGRGQEIRVWPLSFREYYSAMGGDRNAAWTDYYTYGGLPQVLQLPSEQGKMEYLRNIFELTYLNDVAERYSLRNSEGLRQIIQVMASSIGSSTNAKRISDTFKTKEKVSVSPNTIKLYLSYLQDAFLIEEAQRYDVKGRKYIGTENKYYFSDMGLRAAILNFRQQEEPHIFENIIYNELRQRGYLVDVGFVETWERNQQGDKLRKRFEIDFVVNKGPERIYIQSAYRIPTLEKEHQEQRSLLNINDTFRKVIIVGDSVRRKIDENGIITINILDFLLDTESLIP